MIHSTAQLNEGEVARHYPYLGRSSKHGYVVLFSAENTGTAVQSPIPEVRVGEYAQNWNELNFIPLTAGESVTLSNYPLEDSEEDDARG